MGEHSAPAHSALYNAGAALWKHRRKIASALIVALPIVSRFVPDFPAGEIVSALRAFLGA